MTITVNEARTNAAEPEREEPDVHAVAFILKLGRALHTHGYSADRLEEVLTQVSSRLGLHGEFFSTPTSIFAALGPEARQRTHLIRVQPGQTNLGRLASLDAITRDVVEGRVLPAVGAARIDAVLAQPAPYSRTTTVLAFGLVSCAACRFLGGGAREMAVSAGVGLLIGLLPPWFASRPSLARLFELCAAFIAAFVVTAVGALVGGFSTFTATLGGLLVLVPGLAVTVAMTELAREHLSSGTARLSGAFIVFLAIIFGVLAGTQTATALFGVPPVVAPHALPAWTEWVAVLVVPAALSVLLQAAPRDLVWILMSGMLSYSSLRLGAAVLGTTLGGFFGALVIGTASNLFARLAGRPASIPLVPGVLLLVPGSIGYRSLTSLAERNVVGGVETGFSMMLVAASLVAGLLFANVVSEKGTGTFLRKS